MKGTWGMVLVVAVTAAAGPAAGPARAADKEEYKQVTEYRPEGWPLPDMTVAVKQGKRWEDRTPQIPGKETKAIGYVGKEYPLFVIWHIDEAPFQITVDADGRAPFDFELFDMDGDGKFEVKTEAYRTGEAPQWVIDRAFRKRGLAPPSEKGPEKPPEE